MHNSSDQLRALCQRQKRAHSRPDATPILRFNAKGGVNLGDAVRLPL
jgi:hypothetical protein